MNILAITRCLCSYKLIRITHLSLSNNGVRKLSSKAAKRVKSKCESTDSKSKKYIDTLNLPVTNFPLSMKNTSNTEKAIQESHFKDLYEWQRKDPERTLEFILHDGPPYANGDVHVGHTLNKIVKDITNRYKLIQGYKVHFVPGWDCHGLPIELKAVKFDGSHDPKYIRQKAREFAREAAAKQRSSFSRLGIMADWFGQSYFTDSKTYEVAQLSAFWELYEKGFVFQDYMPVYWSPSSR